MDGNAILEPRKMYEGKVRVDLLDHTSKFFDEILKRSGVSQEENEMLSKQYEKNAKDAEEKTTKLKGSKGLRTFLIVLAIALLIAGAVGIYFIVEPKDLTIGLSLTIPGFLLAIGIFILIFAYFNKKIKAQQSASDIANKKRDESYQAVVTQISPLLHLFDEAMPTQIIRESVPLIQIDDYFDIKKFDYMHDKYGFLDNDSETSSTLFVMSGSIVGNPFLMLRNLNMNMIDKLYTGTLPISWTERVYDGNGRYRTVVRHQVLTASIRRPAPDYSTYTHLVYANDAAPDLSFSRRPSGVDNRDEKSIEKFVKSKEDDIKKYADEALKENRKFTPMTNEKFEALFGGLDRDHEVQYRLLFTPLAQQNLIELITNPVPFGDDFTFIKRKELNYIATTHSQSFDISGEPRNYIHYSVNKTKENFMNYIDNYFKCIYFDLAPLISIPVYQQHKPKEYIYKKNYMRNYTSYDEEAIVNHFDYHRFLHPSSVTRAILKVLSPYKKGKTDQVTVRAHSFEGIPRVEYVTVMGGDGNPHAVPVPWTEYLPLTQDTPISIKRFANSRYEYNSHQTTLIEKFGNRFNEESATYNRGYVAYFADPEDDNIDSEIDKLFRYNKVNRED